MSCTAPASASRLGWRRFPRPPLALARKTENALRLPYELEVAEGFGAYRINTDRRPISGTDRPWIYGSGIKGLTRLTMDLVHHHPRKLALSVGGAAAPKIDGELTDGCWSGVPALSAGDAGGTALFRHDEENLYLAFERKGAARVKIGVKKTAVGGRDGDFEKDEHFRVSLRSAGGLKVATFAATTSGGRFDSLLDFGLPVPRLPDGAGADARRATVDLGADGTVRLAWSPEGLSVCGEMPKDAAGAEAVSLLSLVFVLPDVNCAQELTLEAAQGKVRAKTWAGGGASAAKFAASAKIEGKTAVMEGLIPWADLGVEGKAGAGVLLHIRLGSPKEGLSDKAGGAVLTARRRHSADRADTAFHLVLSAGAEAPAAAVKTFRNRLAAGAFELIPVVRDDAGWNGEWTAAAKRDDAGFRVEMAIPWKTLAAAGIPRDRLELECLKLGRWFGPQDKVLAAFAESAADVQAWDKAPEPAAYAVRLHFAEPDDVRPGERVFDVVLNGKVVLKDVDVVREAGGRMKALVREIPDLRADSRLELRLVAKSAGALTERNAPILSGIEVVRR